MAIIFKQFNIKGPKGLIKDIQLFDSGTIFDNLEGKTYTSFVKTKDRETITFNEDNILNCYDYRRKVDIRFNVGSALLNDDGTPMYKSVIREISTTSMVNQSLTFNVPEVDGYYKNNQTVSCNVDADVGTLKKDVYTHLHYVNYTYNLYSVEGTIVYTGSGSGVDGSVIKLSIPEIKGYQNLQSDVDIKLNCVDFDNDGQPVLNLENKFDIMDVYQLS